jgi:tRNA dimethylallyltransferase
MRSSIRTSAIGSGNKLPVLVISGPTASGKSGAVFSLFAPKDGSRPLCPGVGVEVVSADSMQVYRGMDSGTAKPSPGERLLLPHHLVDVLSPSEQFTAGDFVRRADESVREIRGRGRLPVICGGTVFYVKAFINGSPQSPPSDPAIREAVRKDFTERGTAALIEELAAADPVSAERIHPNDVYRLTRAVEVLRASGKALSSFAPPSAPRECYDFLLIALTREREELNARIDKRVAMMFQNGLAREAAALAASGLGPDDPGMQAIGYREFLEAGPGASEEEIMEAVRRDTRRYSKRQLTFLRSIEGFEWYEAEDLAGIAARVNEWIGGFQGLKREMA